MDSDWAMFGDTIDGYREWKISGTNQINPASSAFISTFIPHTFFPIGCSGWLDRIGGFASIPRNKDAQCAISYQLSEH